MKARTRTTAMLAVCAGLVLAATPFAVAADPGGGGGMWSGGANGTWTSNTGSYSGASSNPSGSSSWSGVSSYPYTGNNSWSGSGNWSGNHNWSAGWSDSHNWYSGHHYRDWDRGYRYSDDYDGDYDSDGSAADCADLHFYNGYWYDSCGDVLASDPYADGDED